MRDRLEERQNCNNRWTQKDYLSRGVGSKHSQEKGKTEYLCGFRHFKPTRGASLAHYWLGGLKGGLELPKWGSLMLMLEEDSWWRRKEEEGCHAESQDRAVQIMLPRKRWTRGKDNRGRRQVVSDCRSSSSLHLVVTSCLIWRATQGKKKIFGRYFHILIELWYLSELSNNSMCLSYSSYKIETVQIYDVL